MPRPPRVSDADILLVARRCFLEHGPATSTNVIAHELGVSQAALFKRFGTKHELMVRALLPPEVPPWVPMLQRGPDERPIPDQLREIGTAMSRFFAEMIPCISTLRASCDMAEVMRSEFKVPPPIRGRMALQAWLESAMSQGRIRGVASRLVAEAFIGALHGRAFMSYIVGESNESQHDVDDLIDVIWLGIAPTERA